MVRKLIIILLTLTLNAQAMEPGFLFYWKGQNSPRCKQLLEAFLVELRSMATDRSIEVEAFPNPYDEKPRSEEGFGKTFELYCEDPRTNSGIPDSLLLQEKGLSEDSKLKLRFSERASGFDATDWLAFQQRYLRPSLANLVPSRIMSNSSTEHEKSQRGLATPTQEATIESPRSSIFQKWWFWSIVGGAGLGIYAITQISGGSSKTMNVEIH